MHPPARFKLTESEWRSVRDEMYAELIAVAKARQIITYSDLALRLPTAYVHPGSYAFTRLLGEVCDAEESAGRGMICALVVSKATGVPGAGFFRGAAARGRDVNDLDRCWHEECERVFDAWADPEAARHHDEQDAAL